MSAATRPAEPLLAASLGDNERIHRVYALLAEGEWPAAVRNAAEYVRSVPVASDVLTAALSGLDRLPGNSRDALAQELQRAEASAGLPTTSRGERDVLMVRQQLLRHRLQPAQPGIPRVVHLIRTDSRTDDLPLMQYLCYRSVLEHCKGYRVMLHTPAPPQGAHWNALLPALDVRIGIPPQWLGTHRLVAAAHQSDVWRVKQVIEHGGFYFDWDLLLLRPPEALRQNACVMAIERQEAEHHEVMGVSAIGAEPASVFLREWLAAMPSVYNPRRYVSHSTVLARELALRHPALVRVLDYRSFYYPGWSEQAMRWLFDPALSLPEDELASHLEASIGIHLFCSHANFLHWARGMTESDVAAGRSNLARLMRPYL